MKTSDLERQPRATVMVPVTTMEEMPLLTEAERAEMLASLKAAEKLIAAGLGSPHDAATFVERLEAVRAKPKSPAGA